MFIQVKYHSGISGSHGLNQLIEYDSQDEANVQKWLITTATLNETTKQKAEEMQINTMEGSDLVDWIHSNLDKLSQATKERLGIIEVPQLIKFRD